MGRHSCLPWGVDGVAGYMDHHPVGGGACPARRLPVKAHFPYSCGSGMPDPYRAADFEGSFPLPPTVPHSTNPTATSFTFVPVAPVRINPPTACRAW